MRKRDKNVSQYDINPYYNSDYYAQNEYPPYLNSETIDSSQRKSSRKSSKQSRANHDLYVEVPRRISHRRHRSHREYNSSRNIHPPPASRSRSIPHMGQYYTNQYYT